MISNLPVKRIFFKILFFLILIIVTLLGSEGVFRIYGYTGRYKYKIMKFEEVMKKTWFKPHPYLVYVFKSNNKFVMNAFNNDTFTINKFGFRSTLEYDVQSVSKAPNTLRVAVFGGSTTMGVNGDHEIWAYLIGKNLKSHFPDKKIEILNEGIMGYTSLDNMIDLSIRIIDFKSDVYVLYLGINDYLASAPPDVFCTDHSHYRKTLWETLSFSYIELIPDWLLKSQLVTAGIHALGVPDRRNLLSNTGTGIFRKNYVIKEKEKEEVDKKIKDTLMRNVMNMVGMIRMQNPKALILLSSFYHLDNPKYIIDLNFAFKRYAHESGIIFVDPAGKMPHDQKMVFDYGHFTREGDRRMAEIFSEAILGAL